MPNIDLDIEVYEFVRACSKRDIKELIKELVDEGHLPKDLYFKNGELKKEMNRKLSSEIDFEEKLDKLKTKYFSLNKDEEDSLEKIFKKHL
jgi:L-arabinose isomerase